VCAYLQRQIACLVAIKIVVALEVINIDHQEAHRIIVALGTIQFLRQTHFEVTSVGQACKWISDGHQLKLGGSLLPLCALESHSHLRANELEHIQIHLVEVPSTRFVRRVENTNLASADRERIADKGL